jgi:hypothetical protein
VSLSVDHIAAEMHGSKETNPSLHPCVLAVIFYRKRVYP